MDDEVVSDTPRAPQVEQKQSVPPGVSLAQRVMLVCGAVLIITGAGAILYGLWQITGPSDRAKLAVEIAAQTDSALWAFIIANNEVVLFLVSGISSILLGTGLMRKAVAATAQTIADKDRSLLEPLIRDHSGDAIGQYVRLASLSGMTGVFTKLGFTGLPLATAGLGVFLILLAVFEKDAGTAAQLMDLAKLVVGAFIGSFVQRKAASQGDNAPEQNL
ncbi:hypothetical protein EBB79_17210 [Parasedimentitalea marina]|uniref:Uncharacterized protein n=1 Tax=Parasedimentitalea marina TaxID=2483033 RepID=A0A3T0N648_9RHOB|nr:hypothetical protein [Parasedimentitalea marina]AZV79432.1 hypothetical protein EBB79_17210 [Parasedimentitalea marina]